jgi:hypothetical protein
MSPDWAAAPTTVPYAKFGDPQSLNLYSYTENGPVNRIDPTGHFNDPFGVFSSGDTGNSNMGSAGGPAMQGDDLKAPNCGGNPNCHVTITPLTQTSSQQDGQTVITGSTAVTATTTNGNIESRNEAVVVTYYHDKQ